MSLISSSGLGDALFTKTQQRVLGLLFGTPDRAFYTNEIVRRAGVGTGAALREIDKLCSADLLTVTRVGNQKHYQANAASPIFDELRSIVRKTFGIADVLREALSTLEDRIEVAFVYGSIASGADTAASDVDLFILGHDLSYADLMLRLADAESSLRRKVSPTLYAPSELERKLGEGNAFVLRVVDQPKIFLIGSPRELRTRESRAPGRDR
jgi:predicted nucleotidyltransferase